jgi:phospholipase/lecithinase/hemolysin
MRRILALGTALLSALVLVACGGSGSDGNQAPKVKFSSMVSFGDSLSDVGTYKVGMIAALGGGMYTVNSDSAKNWTTLVSAQLGLPAPCPARTGLNGSVFGVSPAYHPECRNYAQGGSRVVHPFGPGNANLGGNNALLGQLTDSVEAQITRHLTVAGGSFSGTELVTVVAGANDLFMQFQVLDAFANGYFAVYAPGIAMWSDQDAASVYAAAPGGMNAVVGAMAPIMARKMSDAATDLANLIKTQIVANGAKYVLVMNMPNVSRTPFALGLNNPGLAAVLDGMTQAFNATLRTALAGTSGVKFGDAYASNTDQFNNPAQYGLTNVTTPACVLAAPANPIGSSLACSTANVIAGDVSKYLFADGVHPSPYGQFLLAQDAVKYLLAAGWL